MTLGQKQRAFAKAFATLVLKAYEMGYEITYGDGYRSPKVFGAFGDRKKGAYGSRNSLHKLKLAHDINLFKDGEYLQETEDHKPLGEWWLEQYGHMGAEWGGDKGRNDGNHYSFGHRGYW